MCIIHTYMHACMQLNCAFTHLIHTYTHKCLQFSLFRSCTRTRVYICRSIYLRIYIDRSYMHGCARNYTRMHAYTRAMLDLHVCHHGEGGLEVGLGVQL